MDENEVIFKLGVVCMVVIAISACIGGIYETVNSIQKEKMYEVCMTSTNNHELCFKDFYINK